VLRDVEDHVEVELIRPVIRREDAAERVHVVLRREPAEGILELKADTFVGVECHANCRAPSRRKHIAQVTGEERRAAAEMELDLLVLSIRRPRDQRENGSAKK
jgi:hypothetical protein